MVLARRRYFLTLGNALISTIAQFGQILVNSTFTLSLVIGLSVAHTTLGTTIGNPGFAKIDFSNPVFIGDTITAKPPYWRPASPNLAQTAAFFFEHIGVNQRDEVVRRAQRNAMMKTQVS